MGHLMGACVNQQLRIRLLGDVRAAAFRTEQFLGPEMPNPHDAHVQAFISQKISGSVQENPERDPSLTLRARIGYSGRSTLVLMIS
jgi:hypothetical protein